MPTIRKKTTRPAKRPVTAKKIKPRAALAQDNASDGLLVGARVKHARLLAGKRMRDLAEAVGYTESMISKIESGRVVPSLPMLHKIVAALGRDMSSFFGSDINAPGIVLRHGQRAVLLTDPLRQSPGVSYERLVPFAAGNLLECNIHVIEPGGTKVDDITHQGETVGYVLEGRIELVIDTTPYELGTGDSFFFKNHLTNRYRNLGPGIARVLWVNTPQIH